MATVTFNIPYEVAEAFNKVFGNQDKDAVIAKLMRRAVDEHHLPKRHEQLFRKLTNARSRRPTATAEQISNARTSGRS